MYRADWWDRATPDQIGGALTTAHAWAQEDQEAGRAEARIRDELRTRYGIDVDNAGGDPAAVRAAVEAGQARRQAAVEDRQSSVEVADAAALLHQADRSDRAAEAARNHAESTTDPDERAAAEVEADRYERTAAADARDAVPLYDSADRRAMTADELRARGIEQPALDAKMAADISQAKPATAAVTRTTSRTVKARTGRIKPGRVPRSEIGR